MVVPADAGMFLALCMMPLSQSDEIESLVLVTGSLSQGSLP